MEQFIQLISSPFERSGRGNAHNLTLNIAEAELEPVERNRINAVL